MRGIREGGWIVRNHMSVVSESSQMQNIIVLMVVCKPKGVEEGHNVWYEKS